ncbi:retrovirus-related pol polyprotein from transposon TNT 1-94 [Tanacetum coccineum]
MTGNRSWLRNFVKKFTGTVRFGNDHFVAIMGYGYYVIGESVISRKHSCYVRDTDGVELIKEAARTMLIFSKATMFLWAEAVATACYTQNQSFIHTFHNKTPYELVHDKKPDLTFFSVFGALCYPTNDSEDLRKLQPTADIDDVCTYDISAKYGIFHWWFTRQKFYIDRHDSLSRRKDVRTHMQILSVDFKNLYPNDFEDLNLLLLQGHLDYLSGSDKTDAIYCCQALDPKLRWDATRYEFKHDYTIIESPRAVVFPVNNNKQKIMRFNEIYKFSDGTFTRILEARAYRVKEFKIKRLNSGMNTRFWTEKDVRRNNEFIAAIERRLKTRRIYRNLECFVGGCVRDIDYRLLQRTE